MSSASLMLFWIPMAAHLMNEEFSLTVGKDKDYRKNIQTLFPEIHSGTMPG